MILHRYFNKKAREFLDSNPLLKDDAEADDTIPLYLAIQARTENQWGLQEMFRKCAQKLSLTVIDHRSWHPRGKHAAVVTEMYVQDAVLRIHNPACYLKNEASPQDMDELGEASEDLRASNLNPMTSMHFVGVDLAAEDEAIDRRIEEVRRGKFQPVYDQRGFRYTTLEFLTG